MFFYVLLKAKGPKPLTRPSASALFQNSVNLGKVVVFCENQTFRPAGGCLCRIYSCFEIHRSVCPRPGRANALFHKFILSDVLWFYQTRPSGWWFRKMIRSFWKIGPLSKILRWIHLVRLSDIKFFALQNKKHAQERWTLERPRRSCMNWIRTDWIVMLRLGSRKWACFVDFACKGF